ncbi:MAG: hypothetical protein F9K30_19620 [Dechloromonas sp.]|nr:MAG: hypothetical protein F9K30_19620 [Dechloromonas sp.]
MRMNLKVAFAEKDEAKKLGARWDAARKLWYVEDARDLDAFARWSPTPHVAGDAVAASAPPRAAGRQSAGKLVIGAGYVAHAPVCDCPPWLLCERCRPSALTLAGECP